MSMPWTWLGALALLGWSQRSLPWFAASKVRFSPAVEKWFNYVSSAAFATFIVLDIRSVSPQTVVSLGAAAIVGWRTRNLGLVVAAALTVSLVWQAAGGL
jgi:branched-subunit amino acid transport protein